MTALAVGLRFLHLAASAQLVGVFVFVVAIARPAAERAGLPADPGAWLDRRLLRLAGWALATALLTGLASIVVQAAAVAGASGVSVSPAALAEFVGGTHAGRVWITRLAGLVLLGAFLLLREGEPERRDWLALRLEGALLGAFALAALAWAGHAATADEWGLWPLVADSLHLLLTGAWLGGLVPLAVLLGWALAAPSGDAVAAAREATRRFSALALGAVTLLLLTGTANAAFQVRDFPPLVGTPYGRLLLAKLALLAPLLAIAAVNLRRLKPHLLAAETEAGLRRDLARLRRNVALEASLGIGILLLVGGLAVTPPARHVQPSWPFPFRFAWQATRDLPGVQTRVAIGSQLAMLGLVATLLAALAPNRRSRWVAAAGVVALGGGLAVALRPLAVDAYPTTYVRPAVPYTAGSIVSGLRLYDAHCATCHGTAGEGDGPQARTLQPKPADLTARHAAEHTAGDLFWWIGRGVPRTAMPGFADRLSEEERWDVVNSVRALAAGKQARALGPTLTPTAAVVAPDFAYTVGVGDGRALKDYRGQSIVVLVLFTLPESAERLAELARVYRRLRQGGAEILAVPVGAGREVYRALGGQPIFFPIVIDGAAVAAAAYALFGEPPPAAPPRHMELLIDRQGYVRARWRPGDADGWADPGRLAAEVERLAAEAPRAPVADEHVH